MRRVVAVLSDTHAGSTFGLCNPATVLHDEDRGDYSPSLTVGQRWLWKWYESHILSLMEFANDDPVDLIHLGDVCQGVRFVDGLAESRLSNQIRVAMANVEPWDCWPNIKSKLMVSGTDVHESSEGSIGDLVASFWGATFLHHGLLDIDGVLLDVAHHGPSVGQRAWTNGNVARLYLMDRVMRDKPAARLYLRGHRHETVQVTIHKDADTYDLVVVPAYQLPGSYVRRVNQSLSSAVCGMVAISIVDGHLTEIMPFTRGIDLRKRVQL